MAMITLVVLRCVAWAICPLTTWEEALVEFGRQQGATRSAFGQFMHDLIHPDLPNVPVQTYHLIYTAFAVLVAASFWLVPVNWRPHRRDEAPADALPAPHA